MEHKDTLMYREPTVEENKNYKTVIAEPLKTRKILALLTSILFFPFIPICLYVSTNRLVVIPILLIEMLIIYSYRQVPKSIYEVSRLLKNGNYSICMLSALEEQKDNSELTFKVFVAQTTDGNFSYPIADCGETVEIYGDYEKLYETGKGVLLRLELKEGTKYYVSHKI